MQNFARAGCKLVLTDVNDKGLDQTIKETGLEKGWVVKRVVDIGDEGAMEGLVESIPKAFGRLDYAVCVFSFKFGWRSDFWWLVGVCRNAAAICGRYAPLAEETMERIEQVFVLLGLSFSIYLII